MGKNPISKAKGQMPGDKKVRNLAMEIPKRPEKPQSGNAGKNDSGKK
jgi:hypothetical protein